VGKLVPKGANAILSVHMSALLNGPGSRGLKKALHETKEIAAMRKDFEEGLGFPMQAIDWIVVSQESDAQGGQNWIAVRANRSVKAPPGGVAVGPKDVLVGRTSTKGLARRETTRPLSEALEENKRSPITLAVTSDAVPTALAAQLKGSLAKTESILFAVELQKNALVLRLALHLPKDVSVPQAAKEYAHTLQGLLPYLEGQENAMKKRPMPSGKTAEWYQRHLEKALSGLIAGIKKGRITQREHALQHSIVIASEEPGLALLALLPKKRAN